MKSEKDEVLLRLRDAIDPILTEMDEDLEVDQAALVIGAITTVGPNGDADGLKTYIDVVGDYGLIQEAVYTELMDAINSGSPELFQALREVIKKIETDLELDDGATLPSESRTLH